MVSVGLGWGCEGGIRHGLWAWSLERENRGWQGWGVGHTRANQCEPRAGTEVDEVDLSLLP